MTKLELTQQSIEVNGVTLSVRSSPRTGNPLLYCLHGGPGLDSESLLPGILHLTRDFDLKLIDLRGEGSSSRPVNGDYSLKAYVEDLFQLVSNDRSQRPIGILGHSFGACIAIEALGDVRNPFQFGILSNPPCDSEWREFADAAFSSQANQEVAAAQARFSERLKSGVTDQDYAELMIGLRSLYFPELSSDESSRLMRKWTYRIEPYLYGSQKVFPNLDSLKESRARVRVPCLAIGGNSDPLLPPTYMKRYPEVIQGCELKMIPKTGHFSFLTEPEAFYQAVSQWWEVQQKGK